MIYIALYRPDIPQNTGTILRMAACLSLHVDIVEPCGFVFGGDALRRSSMDYLPHVSFTRHTDDDAFLGAVAQRQSRLIVASTKASVPYTQFSFQKNDTLVLGQESQGLPNYLHTLAHSRVFIPMMADFRSLNVAMVTGMIVGEMMRQLA